MSPSAYSGREAQSAAAVLLVRPAHFQFNTQTAASNVFQAAPQCAETFEPQARVRAEFDSLVAALEGHGIRTWVAADTETPPKPDAIYPNNWVSFHHDGRVVLYPMMALNRRSERRTDIIEQVLREGSYACGVTVDLSHYECEGRFLEGTGSLVLDRLRGVAYACLSPRTDALVLGDFARQLGYECVTFAAVDARRRPIYHTNVVMSVGTEFAVICSETIESAQERAAVLASLQGSGRRLVEISRRQMHEFAANLLELSSPTGKVIALSTRALASLDTSQRRVLEACATLMPVSIPTIETLGGGGVRCMLAEVHLPKRGELMA